MDDERGDPFFVSTWVELQFGIHLRRLAAVLSTFLREPRDCRLETTIGGYNQANALRVSQIEFLADARPSIVNGKPIWMIRQTIRPPTIIGGFPYSTSGKTRVADAILAG